MTKEAQRIAIAEVCGWKNHEMQGWQFWDAPDGSPKMRDNIPNYPSDLNAMHEAEKTLEQHFQDDYAHHLFSLVPSDENHGPDCEGLDIMIPSQWSLATATAPQRAEAFLRTLGLWKEEEEP